MSRPTQNQSIPCPRCGQTTLLTENPFRPFCSEKCRTIDLGRWAGEDYRIPGERVDPPDEGQGLSFNEKSSRSGDAE